MTQAIQPKTTKPVQTAEQSELSKMLGTPETFWGWARHLLLNGGAPLSEAKREELHKLWAMDDTTIAFAKGMVGMALAMPEAQKQIEEVIAYMPKDKQAYYRDPKVQEEILNTAVEWAIKIAPDSKWNELLQKHGGTIGKAYALKVVADKVKEGTLKVLDAGANLMGWLLGKKDKALPAGTTPPALPARKDQFVDVQAKPAS